MLCKEQTCIYYGARTSLFSENSQLSKNGNDKNLCFHLFYKGINLIIMKYQGTRKRSVLRRHSDIIARHLTNFSYWHKDILYHIESPKSWLLLPLWLELQCPRGALTFRLLIPNLLHQPTPKGYQNRSLCPKHRNYPTRLRHQKSAELAQIQSSFPEFSIINRKQFNEQKFLRPRKKYTFSGRTFPIWDFNFENIDFFSGSGTGELARVATSRGIARFGEKQVVDNMSGSEVPTRLYLHHNLDILEMKKNIGSLKSMIILPVPVVLSLRLRLRLRFFTDVGWVECDGGEMARRAEKHLSLIKITKKMIIPAFISISGQITGKGSCRVTEKLPEPVIFNVSRRRGPQINTSSLTRISRLDLPTGCSWIELSNSIMASLAPWNVTFGSGCKLGKTSSIAGFLFLPRPLFLGFGVLTPLGARLPLGLVRFLAALAISRVNFRVRLTSGTISSRWVLVASGPRCCDVSGSGFLRTWPQGPPKSESKRREEFPVKHLKKLPERLMSKLVSSKGWSSGTFSSAILRSRILNSQTTRPSSPFTARTLSIRSCITTRALRTSLRPPFVPFPRNFWPSDPSRLEISKLRVIFCVSTYKMRVVNNNEMREELTFQKTKMLTSSVLAIISEIRLSSADIPRKRSEYLISSLWTSATVSTYAVNQLRLSRLIFPELNNPTYVGSVGDHLRASLESTSVLMSVLEVRGFDPSSCKYCSPTQAPRLPSTRLPSARASILRASEVVNKNPAIKNTKSLTGKIFESIFKIIHLFDKSGVGAIVNIVDNLGHIIRLVVEFTRVGVNTINRNRRWNRESRPGSNTDLNIVIHTPNGGTLSTNDTVTGDGFSDQTGVNLSKLKEYSKFSNAESITSKDRSTYRLKILGCLNSGDISFNARKFFIKRYGRFSFFRVGLAHSSWVYENLEKIELNRIILEQRTNNRNRRNICRVGMRSKCEEIGKELKNKLAKNRDSREFIATESTKRRRLNIKLNKNWQVSLHKISLQMSKNYVSTENTDRSLSPNREISSRKRELRHTFGSHCPLFFSVRLRLSPGLLSREKMVNRHLANHRGERKPIIDGVKSSEHQLEVEKLVITNTKNL